MKNKLTKRILSLVLAVVLVFSCLPLIAAAAEGEDPSHFNRVVDANTMNGWMKYFDLNNLDTSNAGGVWTDKSVFINADAFPDGVTMLDGDKNFLTALSALAANKEVVGYSTIPTDTVLVLDVSGSMNQDEASLVAAANDAISRLLKINKNNRVGVVLYSASNDTGSSSYTESVTRLLPIDRYTTTNNAYLTASNNRVSVGRNTRAEGKPTVSINASKSVAGGTYIQAGLWEAMEMFEEMDTVVGDNNWQADEQRMPILVLMSDGAPSTGTSYYDDVKNSKYTSGFRQYDGSNVGNGNESNMTIGQGFLVQLTASYIKNRIQNHYKAEDGTAKSLFYTLGFNLSDSNAVALSVLNPDKSTATDNLWDSYNKLNTAGKLSVNVKNRNGDYSDVSIGKNSYVTNKSYVDEYFSASGAGLTNVFASIIDEIILQSRYYPTHLEGGNPDFSGYVEFTDVLGEYMEVKDIKGILLGTTLFDGHMMASKLADTTENGLGTPERPTELGDEFITSVKTRLGIANTTDARALVAKAYNSGQLKYNSATDWSNYIGWYAKADGTYNGFWDENSNDPAPEGSVYKIKSYGFLGETSGSIKNSDMMYMTVQVATNIATGQQTVFWKIPAALVPMVTYSVTLTGTNVDQATDISVKVSDADTVSPIRLVYETGLRSDLNEFNITRITESKHIAADGHTRLFWNNHFDISAASHDDHVTAIAEFTPNKDNERFYFTFNSAVHKKVGDDYVLVGQNETLDENGEYYHRRYIFKENSTVPVFFYEKMSAASIKTAKLNGWKADFETLDGTLGAWVVPAGTPARELQMYDEEKAVNATNSAHMVFHPYLAEQNNTVYVDMNLGNNGLLSVTPATGIKVSKSIDIYETGTSDTFKFRINADLNGSYDAYITAIGETPYGEAEKVTFKNGAYEFELKKDQTLWLSGIPAGTSYTVEEISDNSDYKIKSVHVNGVATGKTAVGTVAQYLVDDVQFVNTAIGEGDLVITKQVVDQNGNEVDINNNVKFNATVKLTDDSGNPVSGTFTSSNGNITVPANGEFNITLSEGESFVIRGIPEETNYTVTETNIPTGFEFNASESTMTGVIDSTANDIAIIVNNYKPTAINGADVDVLVTKEISGNRTEWMPGENYTFVLEQIDVSRSAGTVIAEKTIKYSDTDKQTLFDLASENYTEAGAYFYRITEKKGAQGGITYDSAERRFVVVVADTDFDGDLEIVSVYNELNTVVNGNWVVNANFNNVYAPAGSATATINIEKILNGAPLNGYQFALYNADPTIGDAEEITRSGLTDAHGKASITLVYAANRATMAGVTYTYYLAEVNAGQTINNIKYSEEVYKVEVTVKDNGDGTVSANTKITGQNTVTIPTFTNTYVPSSSDFVTITGNKTTTDNRIINSGEFSFVITPDLTHNANTPVPDELVVKNNADGSFVFGTIEFKDEHKGNTYKYTVEEVKTNPISGFTYDTTVYTVTVTVTDNGDQTITATAVINNGTSDVEDIVFHNVYDPTDVTVELDGEKLLTGKVMQDKEFEFSVEAVTNGAPDFSNATANNDADGNISFGSVTFDKAGVYVYTVTEKIGTDARYDYDKSVYTVTITVRDDSEGTLSATVVYDKNGLAATEIVFKNGFVPEVLSYNIHTDFGGKKVLNGRELADGEFEFALINAIDGQQIGETVKNGANGEFRFENVELPQAGVYHYKIVEVIGDEKGVSYDTNSYHIRLEVVQEDNGDLTIIDKKLYVGVIEKVEVSGILTEVTSYENITGIGDITFTNTYKAVPGEIVIEGKKTLNGATLLGDDFEFTLYEGEDEIQTVKNDADGNIVFEAIPVTDAGTYVYTVKEVKGTKEGMTYDESVYTVTVTVTDNLDGTFAVLYAYTKGNDTVTGIEFVNNYTEPEPPFISPETGDRSNVWLLFALMFVSGGCLIGSVIAIKKEKSK